MAAWPVVLGMSVDDYKYARKIRKAIENKRGVRSVWSSPEQGLVVVHGTADAWALRQRIWAKLKRHYYDPPQPAYGPPAHAYYSHPPAHGYYSHPPAHGYYSPPPPPGSYRYAAGGYDGWAADPDPYGYAAYSTVPTCSIM